MKTLRWLPRTSTVVAMEAIYRLTEAQGARKDGVQTIVKQKTRSNEEEASSPNGMG